MSLTHTAHQIVIEHLTNTASPRNLAVDATCGNGHDSLFLCEQGFTRVMGFDIQKAAIEKTRQRCQQAGYSHIELVLNGHQHISEYIQHPVDVMMFNLGYLPNADKNKTTLADSTLQALTSALPLLSNRGLITLLCYPGHATGKIETQQVQQWLQQLPKQWRTTTHLATVPSATAPILYVITAHQ